MQEPRYVIQLIQIAHYDYTVFLLNIIIIILSLGLLCRSANEAAQHKKTTRSSHLSVCGRDFDRHRLLSLSYFHKLFVVTMEMDGTYCQELTDTNRQEGSVIRTCFYSTGGYSPLWDGCLSLFSL